MNGKMIYKFRQRMGWSQARLAHEMCVLPNTVARWERDELKASAMAARLFELLVEHYEPRRAK